jgi:hypothetical protein
MTLLILLAISLLGAFVIVWRQSISFDSLITTQADPSHHTGDQSSSSQSSSRSRFSTLALIEAGLGCRPGTLTQTVDAERLEQRASILISEYMSETSLLTGLVPRRVFDRIVAELLHDQPLASDPIAIADRTSLRAAETTIVPAA